MRTRNVLIADNEAFPATGTTATFTLTGQGNLGEHGGQVELFVQHNAATLTMEVEQLVRYKKDDGNEIGFWAPMIISGGNDLTKRTLTTTEPTASIAFPCIADSFRVNVSGDVAGVCTLIATIAEIK